MEILNAELSPYGSKNECTRTNTVLPPISEFSTRAVSLVQPDWVEPGGITSHNLFANWEKNLNFFHVLNFCSCTIYIKLNVF